MMNVGQQLEVSGSLYRGGTSRGAVIHLSDLPADAALRDEVILAIYGSPDARQIDGIGGAHPLTSKVALVRPSTRADCDVDYIFGQVHITEARIDYIGTCGNMISAVAAFAVDEDLVPAVEPATLIRIHDVNTATVVLATVRVAKGRAMVDGSTRIAGVSGTGSPIELDYSRAVGTVGRGVLPTGSTSDRLVLDDGTSLEVSMVDCGTAPVFVRAADLGLRGDESPAELEASASLIDTVAEVRGRAATLIGLAPDWRSANLLTPGVPKIYIVAPRHDNGSDPHAAHLLGRGFSMGRAHNAYAVSAAVATAVAVKIPGTLPAAVASPSIGDLVTIHTPEGSLDLIVDVKSSERTPHVERVSVVRTARRVASGTFLVPLTRIAATSIASPVPSPPSNVKAM